MFFLLAIFNDFSFQESCVDAFAKKKKKEKRKEQEERSRRETKASELSRPSVAKSADLCSSNVHHCPRGGLCQRLEGRIRRPAPRLALSNFGIKARRERFSVN